MQFDQSFFDTLYTGRRWKRCNGAAGVDHSLSSQLKPLKQFAIGFESVISTHGRYLLSVRNVHPRRDFEDISHGLGRIVFVFHLGGRRDTFMLGRPVLTLNEASLAVYFHPRDVQMTCRWYKGSSEKAVVIGSWLPDLPPHFLEHLSDLAPFQGIVNGTGSVHAAQIPMSTRLHRTAEEIHDIRMHPDLIPSYLEARTLEALCLAMDRLGSHLRPTRSAEEHRIKVIHDLLPRIESHLSQQITVESMAREAGMSARDFSSAFQHVMGIKFAEHVSRLRLERARDMLETSQLPLKHIAHLVGYQHTSNLSTALRKAFGLSPRELRSRYQTA